MAFDFLHWQTYHHSRSRWQNGRTRIYTWKTYHTSNKSISIIEEDKRWCSFLYYPWLTYDYDALFLTGDKSWCKIEETYVFHMKTAQISTHARAYWCRDEHLARFAIARVTYSVWNTASELKRRPDQSGLTSRVVFYEEADLSNRKSLMFQSRGEKIRRERHALPEAMEANRSLKTRRSRSSGLAGNSTSNLHVRSCTPMRNPTDITMCLFWYQAWPVTVHRLHCNKRLRCRRTVRLLCTRDKATVCRPIC